MSRVSLGIPSFSLYPQILQKAQEEQKPSSPYRSQVTPQSGMDTLKTGAFTPPPASKPGMDTLKTGAFTPPPASKPEQSSAPSYGGYSLDQHQKRMEMAMKHGVRDPQGQKYPRYGATSEKEMAAGKTPSHDWMTTRLNNLHNQQQQLAQLQELDKQKKPYSHPNDPSKVGTLQDVNDALHDVYSQQSDVIGPHHYDVRLPADYQDPYRHNQDSWMGKPPSNIKPDTTEKSIRITFGPKR